MKHEAEMGRKKAEKMWACGCAPGSLTERLSRVRSRLYQLKCFEKYEISLTTRRDVSVRAFPTVNIVHFFQ